MSPLFSAQSSNDLPAKSDPDYHTPETHFSFEITNHNTRVNNTHHEYYHVHAKKSQKKR